MVGTTTMMEHGSQAGEPATSNTMNNALKVTLLSGLGRWPSCLPLCPMPPSAEPQAFTHASSSIFTCLLLRCLPTAQHCVPGHLSEDGQRGFQRKRAQRKQPTSQFIQILFKLGNGEHVCTHTHTYTHICLLFPFSDSHKRHNLRPSVKTRKRLMKL